MERPSFQITQCTKVDSTMQMHEYDDQTQAGIRKIMFDEKQKRKGLPTSDEITQGHIMEKAKYAPGSPFLPEDERELGRPDLVPDEVEWWKT